MPKQAAILTGEHIFWRVAKHDPLTQTLDPVLHARLVNPLAALTTFPELRFRSWDPYFTPDDDVVFSTQSITIECDDSLKVEGYPYVFDVLSSLRHLAGQYRLPSVVQFAGIMRLPERQIKSVWPEAVSVKAECQNEILRSPLRFSSVPHAVQMTTEGGPPIFSTLLLDALRAFDQTDWRMALLLAAMAMETGAVSAIDDWHSARLAAKPRASTVVEVTTPGGSGLKDPVYDILANGTKFERKLHQIPLHLIGRSLLIDNQDAYRRALKLYTTRNKIAHRGGPASQDGACYGLERDDVKEGIRAAIECLAFFGKQVNASLDAQGKQLGTFPGLVPVLVGEFAHDGKKSE